MNDLSLLEMTEIETYFIEWFNMWSIYRNGMNLLFFKQIDYNQGFY